MQTVLQGSKLGSGTLTVEGLWHSYRGLDVFKEFSLRCDSNIVVLRGASGCGKTTLLKILSGNLKPDRVRSMPPSEGSCLVLQEDSLLPWLTGTKNISKIADISETSFRCHPMYVLVADFIDRKACQMSYGQRRMVELFRAIIFQPRFLYLDEPFNFLDEGNIGLVIPFLLEVAMKNTTLVLSNHHRDDNDIFKSANIFKFNGQPPACSLERIN
jgi:ABC-type nitrate/sulfonate/bicarbonate transport system ATPase subunit